MTELLNGQTLLKKKKLLLVNVSANWGSTGHIAETLGQLANENGWESHIVYGRSNNSSKLTYHKYGAKWDVYEHYLEYRLFDNDGLASRKTTQKITRFIDDLSPDVIHLHNIHDHWLNYKILFEFLSTIDIPVVWTQHDCWAFTGGCSHYTFNGCDKWQTNCSDCVLKKGIIPVFDRTYRHFDLKKHLFNSVNKLTLIPVSSWLEGELKKSFLKRNNIKVIYNGIDCSVFTPIQSDIKNQLKCDSGDLLCIGVATTWNKKKGFDDFLKLARILPNNVRLLLVGLKESQIKKLPYGILGIPCTNNTHELVNIYSGADIVLNLSYEETFGLTTVEGLACGTPAIVYNSTASPELITKDTGFIIQPGDITGVKNAINIIKEKGKSAFSDSCRKRALSLFNKDDRYMDYINLYESLVQ